MEANNKLRETLSDATRLLESILEAFSKGMSGVYMSDVAEAIDNARAALAEPVRNCEVGTAEEQAKRMDDFCARHGERIGCSWRCDNCPLCSIDRCDLVWAQMPYVEKEGGAK